MKSDRQLVAHLMRRAGFGATSQELDQLTHSKTYEEIVDDLVNPERFDQIDTSFVERYYGGEPVAVHVGKWLFRMVNTLRPLEEKMSLFLHQVFPVAWGKSEHGPSIYREIQMFREVGLTNFKTVLLQLSKDPAMIFWLDNCFPWELVIILSLTLKMHLELLLDGLLTNHSPCIHMGIMKQYLNLLLKIMILGIKSFWDKREILMEKIL